MSNAKRFISVILAIVMICSTLVVGASAAYTEYKDSAIAGQYNGLDQPVLTTEQYASAAMDELDRMLNKEQIKMTSDELFGIGSLDVTSVDATMDSVYNLVNSTTFKTFGGLLGELSSLSAHSFAPTSSTVTLYDENGQNGKNYNMGGVRRSTSGKTDIDVIYQVLGFLFENKNIFIKFAKGGIDPNKGGIDAGTILPSVVDLSDYTDVNKLLKGLLYEAVYDTDAPEDLSTVTVDDMTQKLIDDIVLEEIPELEGHTGIKTGTMYDFIDNALKILYNTLLVDLLNGNIKYELNKFCGVTGLVTDKDYNVMNDVAGSVEIDGVKTQVVAKDKSAMNQYANILNVDYKVSEYSFDDTKTFASQFNDVLGALLNSIVTSEFKAKFTWNAGNDSLLGNLTAIAKLLVTDEDLSEAFFQPYNVRYTDDEINAMSSERLITYLLTILINNSADELWIPESTATLREFGFYCLQQLLATSAPELDFSSMDKNSTDTLVVMGIDFAIYNINAVLDMGLEYVYDMNGVDAQLAKAAKYGVNNYGGLFNGIEFQNKNDGWRTFDDILFSILDKTWLPTSCSSATYCFKTLLIDTLIDGILDLDVAGLMAKLENHKGGLNDTPLKVIINLAARIINIILPDAMDATASSADALITNDALSATIKAVFTDLYDYRTKLVASILPTLCSILDLTNEQEFEFPEYTYDDLVIPTSGSAINLFIPMRNGSTGINTGYTYYDQSGEKQFHQDSLFTYKIMSVSMNVATPSYFSGAAVSYSVDGINNTTITTGNEPTLAGGKTGYIHLTGSNVTNTGSIVAIKIVYNVLTEDGTSLTSSPIEDTIYLYAAVNKGIIENKITVTGTNYDIEMPANVFAANMGDLEDIEVTVTNKTTNEVIADEAINSVVSGGVTSFNKLTAGGYLKLTENNVIKAGFDDGNEFHPTKTTFKLFETTEAYKKLPNKYPVDEATQEEDKTVTIKSDIFKKLLSDNLGSINATTGLPNLYPKLDKMQFAINIGTAGNQTNVMPTAANANSQMTVYLYDEMGINSMVSSEINKHRQSSNYSNSTAWTDYETALMNAANAAYAPYTISFNTYAKGTAGAIVKTAPVLKDAIEALDKCELAGGFDGILEIIDGINPDNVDKDGEKLSYDDSSYKYFGVADYEPYTYYNYKDAYRAAMSAYEKSLEEDENGNKLYVVNALTVTQLQHKLQLTANRLLKKGTITAHLTARLAAAQKIDLAANEAKYTAASWADYVKAYNFATSVLGTDVASLTQTKVNKAYDVLNEYEKCLVPVGEDEPSGDTPVFNPVDPESKVALTVKEVTGGGVVLGGMEPGADPSTLFTGSNFEVETVKTVSGRTKIATGDTINIKDKTGKVVASYTVCISGDVNCDGEAGSAMDLIAVLNKVNSVTSLSAAQTLAADINGGNDICDAMDLISMLNVVNSIIAIDYNARTTK